MFKRTFAAVLAAAMAAVSFTGCSKAPSAAASFEGGVIPAGVYIFAENSQYQAYQGYLGTGDILSMEIGEDMTVADVVAKDAQDAMKRYASVESECKRLDISLTEEEMASVKAGAKETYDAGKEMYEKKGVALSSVEAFGINNTLYGKLFDALYTEGGEKAVPNDEMVKYAENTYRKATVIDFKFQDPEGKPLSEDMLKKEQDDVKAMFSSIENGEKSFMDVYKEVYTKRGSTFTDADTSESLAGIFKVTDSRLPQDMVLEMFKKEDADNGKTFLFEGEDAYYIYQMHSFDAPSFVAEQKNNIIYEMKNQDFADYLLAKADEIGFAFDESALKAYDIKKIAKR